MWYITLFDLLVKKIAPEEQQDATTFLTDLFENIKSQLNVKEFAPIVLLGVLDKAFTQFENVPDGSVNLVKFSHFIFGLSVIYTKFAEEETALWNIDFEPILLKKSIKNSLDLDKDAPKRPRDFINRTERKILADLDFKLEIDFSHLKNIFFMANSSEAAEQFCKNYFELIGQSPKFDTFINELQALFALPSQPPIIEAEHTVQMFEPPTATTTQVIVAEELEVDPPAKITEKSADDSFQIEITAMKKFGNLLMLKDEFKGKIVIQLAEDLSDKWTEILKFKESHDYSTLRQKKGEFTTLLHSQDDKLNSHRKIWKPIIANIALAFTFIGAIAIVGKAIYTTCYTGKFSFNSAFFFAKTNSQLQVEELEKSWLSSPAA